jgi:hypothetical protein
MPKLYNIARLKGLWKSISAMNVARLRARRLQINYLGAISVTGRITVIRA